MLLLAIDTSTAAATVALHDGVRVAAEVTTVDPLAHGERLAPNLVSVFADAAREPGEVTDVAVGVGPGPYTGLRVGLVTARTFGYLRSVPVQGVCSLDALAWQGFSQLEAELGGDVLVASDARRKEVYWARYRLDDQGPTRIDGPGVDRPEVVAQRFPGVPVVGRGGQLYAAQLGPWVGLTHVSAGYLAEVALRGLSDTRTSMLQPDPLYLRRPDTSAPRAAKSVLG